MKSRSGQRRGALIPLVALLIVFLVGMIAFALDLGYIVLVRTQLQAAADASALAAASEMLDREALKGPTQIDESEEMAYGRGEAQRIALLNKAGGVYLNVPDNPDNSQSGDIVFGHMSNPRDQTTSMTWNTHPYNSVQVRVRRDTTANQPINLFFARVFGYNRCEVSAMATATYEGNIRGFQIAAGSAVQTSKLLPFALDINVYNAVASGVGSDTFSYNPDTEAVSGGPDGIKEGMMYPWDSAAGNFGTIDIGGSFNSTSDLARQVRFGPNQADFDLMGGSFSLGADGTRVVIGDTGISAAMKEDLISIIGQPRIIPLYLPPVVATGNNAQYTIVGFAGIIITDVKLTGGNKYVKFQPEYVIDRNTIPGGPAGSSPFVYGPLQLSR